jgi:putative membrane protein
VRLLWTGFAILVGAEICYPLTAGGTRAALVIGTVLLGGALSVAHAALTRGARAALALVAVAAGGGLLVEAVGVATGFPFGRYGYGEALGPTVLGVPVVVPVAWAWMAWPAWLAAGVLTMRWRVPVAAVGLAAWDLFLDPQMVAAGYWTWAGEATVPATNYLGWLGVSLVMMALLALAVPSPVDRRADAPMLAVYLWTYYSSVLAHAVFLDLPASALWGGIAMGAVAVPVSVRLVR